MSFFVVKHKIRYLSEVHTVIFHILKAKRVLILAENVVWQFMSNVGLGQHEGEWWQNWLFGRTNSITRSYFDLFSVTVSWFLFSFVVRFVDVQSCLCSNSFLRSHGLERVCVCVCVKWFSAVCVSCERTGSASRLLPEL